jgi:hypothetical protein
MRASAHQAHSSPSDSPPPAHLACQGQGQAVDAVSPRRQVATVNDLPAAIHGHLPPDLIGIGISSRLGSSCCCLAVCRRQAGRQLAAGLSSPQRVEVSA